MFLVMLDLFEAPGSMAQVSSPSLQWKRPNHPKESPKPKTNKIHQTQECSLWTRSSQQQQAWCKPQNNLQNVHEQNSLNSPKGEKNPTIPSLSIIPIIAILFAESSREFLSFHACNCWRSCKDTSCIQERDASCAYHQGIHTWQTNPSYFLLLLLEDDDDDQSKDSVEA